MHTQSTGTVILASANPSAAPSIDPQFLSHPFDRWLAIESVRGALEFLGLECLKKDEIRLAAGPAGRGDEDILVRGCPFTFFPAPLFKARRWRRAKLRFFDVRLGLRASERGQHVASVRHVQDGTSVGAVDVPAGCRACGLWT